jgi:ribosomal protein RSM22 (predicted rRNA methylase)
VPGTILKLTPAFEKLIQEALALDPARPSDILQLSDFYMNNVGRNTPWDKPYVLPATLAYFMPLNYTRLMSAFRELRRFFKGDEIREIWDFGSGIGTTHWVLEDQDWLEPRPLMSFEISPHARDAHDRLANLRRARWQNKHVKRSTPGAGALAVFSYSFLEMKADLPDLSKFEHILIVEPSLRGLGRALMEWRARFISEGWTSLAPCTHSKACPLLTKSPRDYCHNRIHFDAPEWWLALEADLPMTNKTLTYSYLLLSRSVTHGEWLGRTRVIGDTLHEKGKTRQMVCRGDEREFMSWLHRDGEPPSIPHGALIRGDLRECEMKATEIRAGRDLDWTE